MRKEIGFRICWWNCTNVNRRGNVLEKIICDFGVVCLQETRTRPNRPLVLQDFTVTQRHQGGVITTVVRRDLYKTISSFSLGK